jgi:hypothetical protein
VGSSRTAAGCFQAGALVGKVLYNSHTGWHPGLAIRSSQWPELEACIMAVGSWTPLAFSPANAEVGKREVGWHKVPLAWVFDSGPGVCDPRNHHLSLTGTPQCQGTTPGFPSRGKGYLIYHHALTSRSIDIAARGEASTLAIKGRALRFAGRDRQLD